LYFAIAVAALSFSVLAGIGWLCYLKRNASFVNGICRAVRLQHCDFELMMRSVYPTAYIHVRA
jgi:hypothetical protein